MCIWGNWGAGILAKMIRENSSEVFAEIWGREVQVEEIGSIKALRQEAGKH